MNESLEQFPRFTLVGESGLLVVFDDLLTLAANQQVCALDDQMGASPLAGVLEWLPAYSSLLVLYDPQVVGLAQVKDWVRGCLAASPAGQRPAPKQVEVLVHYGGTDGPDLPFVAEYHHMTTAEVIERHAGGTYHVGMMGFMPGFAYLIGLDPALTTPRLNTPRMHIPAGSVGIAGEQTGVYPLASPGGWQIIGRTDLALFDPNNTPHFTLSPGDEVRFIPADEGVWR